MRKNTVAIAVGVVFSCVTALSAQAVEPTLSADDLELLQQEPQHKVASKRVAGKLSREHYERFSIDNEFSEQVLDRYLKLLDYNRAFLTQGDIAAFTKHKHEFDEMIKSGELQTAYEIYNTISKRRFERFSYALSLLDKEMDFEQKGDTYYYDRSEAPWAKDEAELNEIWRQRVKYDALNLKLTGKEWPEISEMLAKRYNNAIKRLSQTNSEDVFQTVMNAVARTIEPHTSYLSPRNADRFKQDMNLSLEGIGAVLMIKDDYTTIRSLVSGGPAAKSEKLSPDDRIIAVGQKGEELVDVIGWRLDDVVDLIKGPKGSEVVLQVLPKKGGANAKAVDVTLVRDKIRLEDRAVKGKVIEAKEGTFKGQKVGVIEIPSFYMNVSQDVAAKLAEFEDQDIKGVIVDLRTNGGGALTEATALTGLFIERGPVVQIRDASGRISQNEDRDGKLAYDGPLVVMVDRYSASASEIFAAALQDYGRALVVGETTFGKGTVQQHTSLGRMYDMYEKPVGNLQYTIAKFYRINGGSTQIKGVTPDIAFPTAYEAGEHGEADEDNPLPWDKIAKVNYRYQGWITPQLVESLDANYQERVVKDPEYVYVMEDIQEYKARHEDKSISLVESERLAERDADDKKALTRANARLKNEGKEAVESLDDLPDDLESPDLFLDQTVAITLDMSQSNLYVKK
ncbi:carboxy terminal-processing peptidase [Paraferrimonas sedimenticola]|uniref:Tail-specific protease n=1 Tax=Paraferrimonas sedimenticola TaxID=375674 RepID=A0AA37RZI4_9GAMM|nr:carboxy terminal-processing peptidase [Paraferrimonas sedimenticola]GLP98071.1 tail-specific protease [Paraferrimonas sedimenticola]